MVTTRLSSQRSSSSDSATSTPTTAFRGHGGGAANDARERSVPLASCSAVYSSNSSTAAAPIAAAVADSLDPIVSASGVYHHHLHTSSSSSTNGAGFFVAEDVELLQDLLLDVPAPHHDTKVAAENDHPLVLDASTSSPLHDRAVKAEPLAEPAPLLSRPTRKRTPAQAKTANMSVKHEQLSDSHSGTTTATAATGAASSASSQWLQWEDSSRVLDCADLPNASALEVRRLKNRDSMRRSRQRQRDELDKMRATVAQLEREYENLCLRTAPAAAAQASPADAAYLSAIDVAKRLGAENLYLKASIQEQATWKLQVHRVLESDAFDRTSASNRHGSSSRDDSDASLETEEMRAIYGFTPLTDDQVKDVILDSTRQVQGVQNELLLDCRSDSASPRVRSPRDCLTVFGWDIRRRMAGHEMAFAFVKRFPNASALDIMTKTWDADLELKRFKRIKSETRRLDILQQANAHTYVLGRDVRFPDDRRVFRTVYVRFRMETSAELPSSPSGGVSQPLCKNGYVIGTQSINPPELARGGAQPMLPCIDDHETLVWADMTLWMEFFHVFDAATGRDVCEVRWTGKTDYKSETQAYRSAADTLLGLLRWEALAIAPVLTIC